MRRYTGPLAVNARALLTFHCISVSDTAERDRNNAKRTAEFAFPYRFPLIFPANYSRGTSWRNG